MEEFKLVVLGDIGVGKTSMLSYACDGIKVNPDAPSAEASLSFDLKTIELDVSGKKVKANLWDTAGQERNAGALTSSFYRNTDACILVAARGDPNSVEALQGWKEQVTRFSMSTFDPALALVQNKCDLDEEESYSDRLEELAKKFECTYTETSAKTGEGIIEVLQSLAAVVMKRTSPTDLEARSPSRLALTDELKSDEEKTTKRRGCAI